jgi:hypothetical protein
VPKHLITGGTCFIGSHLAEFLLARAGSLIKEDRRINTIAMTTEIIYWIVVLKVAVLIMAVFLFHGGRERSEYSIQISLAQKDQMAAQVILHLLRGSAFE